MQTDPDMHKTLRFWAICDGIYGVALTLLWLFVVPWKFAAANCAGLVYAAAVLAGTPLLWRAHRTGYRLAVITSLVGLLAGIVCCTGLILSWAYLRAIHGVFGMGASIVSLFLAATVFQMLGLYPALRLRMLWRAEMRRAFGQTFRTTPIVTVLVLGPFLLAALVHGRYTLKPVPALAPEARDAAIAWTRAILNRATPDSTLKSRMIGWPRGPGPLVLALFAEGRAQVRIPVGNWDDGGSDLFTAVDEAAHLLAKHPAAIAHPTGRLKFDRSVARGPFISQSDAVLALSIDPGRDGVQSRANPAARFFPDDFILVDIYGVTPLLPFLDEVRLGVDMHWVRTHLALADDEPLERFRIESWIECGTKSCPIERGNTPLSEMDPLASAKAAGAFIARASQPDGTFAYVYRPYTHTIAQPPYNLTRHAGTTYSLAMLESLTPGAEIATATDRALSWMAHRVHRPCGTNPRGACVVEGDASHRKANLGTNALFLVALTERLALRPDEALQSLAGDILAFIASMQKSSGDFFHNFDATAQRILEDDAPQMFCSEEAALALVKAGQHFKETATLQAAERALDYLTDAKYDYFLGRFTFGVDSWTCMAAEAAFSTGLAGLKKGAYLDFCLGYADFLRRLQFQPGQSAASDFDGHFGFSNLLVPQAPAAAGFAEALGAVRSLARAHARSTPDLDRQTELALLALARDQIRADNNYLVLNPAFAEGGIRRSLVQSEIRIDFVQHALSAFVRAARTL
jgi:hypothetical protein